MRDDTARNTNRGPLLPHSGTSGRSGLSNVGQIRNQNQVDGGKRKGKFNVYSLIVVPGASSRETLSFSPF